jgi:hypothetical protein
MKAVIDTNVIVSAALSEKSSPAKIIKAWLEGRYDMVVSPDILDEVRRVLFKPRIRAQSL